MFDKEEENESHVLEVEIGLKRIPQDTDRSAMGLEKLGSPTIEHQPPDAVSHWILTFRLPKPAHPALYMIIAQTSYPPDDYPFRSSCTRPSRTQGDGHIPTKATIVKVPFTPFRSIQSLQLSISSNGTILQFHSSASTDSLHVTRWCCSVYSGSRLKEMVCTH